MLPQIESTLSNDPASARVPLSLIVVAFYRQVLAFAEGTVKAAAVLHSNMIRGVMFAPMLFFESNPSGRILNRFAGDVTDIEQVRVLERGKGKEKVVALSWASHLYSISAKFCGFSPPLSSFLLVMSFLDGR